MLILTSIIIAFTEGHTFRGLSLSVRNTQQINFKSGEFCYIMLLFPILLRPQYTRKVFLVQTTNRKAGHECLQQHQQSHGELRLGTALRRDSETLRRD